MDCEKFESAMMDELYGELDELTSAALKRHMASCARCAALIGGLRATRRVATIPQVDLPAGLEERILEAAREAQKVVPLRGNVARAISMAGTWAMRPQTAMAALFFVMIGTSVLLIRGKPTRTPSAEVTVTEQGAPAPANPAVTSMPVSPAPAASVAVVSRAFESKAPVAAYAAPEELRIGHASAGARAKEKDDESQSGMANASVPGGLANNLPPAAPPPQAAPVATGAGGGFAAQAPADGADRKSLSSVDSAEQAYRAGRFEDATREYDALAPADANAELMAARSVRESKGCRNALARFDKVARRAAGSSTGWDALLEGALCYRAVGDFGQARVRLTQLLKVDSHKDRAQAELDRLSQIQQAQVPAAAPPAAAKRAAPARQMPASAADQSSH